MRKGLLVGLTLAVPLALWAWLLSAERRAVRDLAAEERPALFAHSIAAFEVACGTPPDGLEDHCRDQARFLLHFPECDDRCRRLVGRYRRVGSR